MTIGADGGLAEYLGPTPFIESDHPAIRAFAEAACAGAEDDVGRAVRLFREVRDQVYYDPYSMELTPDGMKASRTLEKKAGFCITKAVLLAAVARAVGIPSRLGFADVRNHLATGRLRHEMGTDLFMYHAYAELWLEGRWVKATPAFNTSLCERFNVEPLDFDGRHDALFQQFDRGGRRYMDYVLDRGRFADLPLEEIAAAFRRHYRDVGAGREHDARAFEREAEREQRGR